MRGKKPLLAIAALAVAGLGWFAWKLGPEPVTQYAFDYQAIVEGDWVAFRSIVGCYPLEAEFMGKTRTVYSLRERVFSKQLKSGNTFYVAVPNACTGARAAGSEDLPEADRQRPVLARPRAIVPLTFMTDGSDQPDTVRLFTALNPMDADHQPVIIQSTIQPLDDTNSQWHERYDEPDPLARAGGWVGVVFVPISGAPQLEQGWIEDRWQAGGCEIARLNEQGRTTIETWDPGGRVIKLFWPQTWSGVPLTDITRNWDLKEAQAAAVQDTLDLVIPAVPTANGFEIRPDQHGMVELFHADSERHEMSTRASAYFYNGIELAKEDREDGLPFVIRCPGEHRLYVPLRLVFLRKNPV
jgi:hypothetical protein